MYQYSCEYFCKYCCDLLMYKRLLWNHQLSYLEKHSELLFRFNMFNYKCQGKPGLRLAFSEQHLSVNTEAEQFKCFNLILLQSA